MTEPGREKPEPLGYRAGGDDAPQMIRQVLAGTLITAGLLIAGIAGLIFFAFAMDYRGFNVPSGKAGTTIAIVVGSLILCGLLIFAYRQYRDVDTRGWAFGIWMGLALSGLVEGICFVSH